MQIDLRRDQRCGFEFVGRSVLCHGRVAELITTQSPRIGASRISFTKNLVELGAVAQASRGELSGDFAAVLDLFEQSVGRPARCERSRIRAAMGNGRECPDTNCPQTPNGHRLARTRMHVRARNHEEFPPCIRGNGRAAARLGKDAAIIGSDAFRRSPPIPINSLSRTRCIDRINFRKAPGEPR